MSGTRSRTARAARTAVALAIGTLVAVLLPVVAEGAQPAPSATATHIRFDSITTPSMPLPDTPGTDGLAFAVAGTPFDVGLTFLDDAGASAPLSWNATVTVTVRLGKTALGSVDVPGGSRTAQVQGLTIAAPAADLTLTASARSRVTGTSAPFDVLIESDAVNTAERTSTGGDAGAVDGCIASLTNPVCADLLPPTSSGFTTGGQLSRGLCSRNDICKNSYIQPLVAFSTSNQDPATLVMKCDKKLCGTGAIQRQVLTVTLSPDPQSAFGGNLVAPACPAKGVVGYDPGQPYGAGNSPFCVDYVQSTRDNAGDTILYLLFVLDLKARFG
jgi:hypothetical protein